MTALAQAVAALGPGLLTEDALTRHIRPLFSRALAAPGIYLANHSLGRPLDSTEDDLREGFRLWQSKLGDAWDDWQQAEQEHRDRLAGLIHAPRPDCIVPKTSAGQGLRTVLNALPSGPHPGAADRALRVVTTTAEFDSIDVILKQYSALGRIALTTVSCHAPGRVDGAIDLAPLREAVSRGADLVVVSQVLFMTGDVLASLDQLAAHCHAYHARLLVDAYHAIGVLPVDAVAMGADFMIGGSYKYLRGGPGACFLYLSPAALESGLRPLDIGWFAKAKPFFYERPEPPAFAPGGDGYLESTPPVLTYYQARAGQQLTLLLGVPRIRAYSLDRQRRLRGYLAERGIESRGADEDHGAFLTLEHENATALAGRLAEQGVVADARGRWLRLCPDYLTTDDELRSAARAVVACLQ